MVPKKSEKWLGFGWNSHFYIVVWGLLMFSFWWDIVKCFPLRINGVDNYIRVWQLFLQFIFGFLSCDNTFFHYNCAFFSFLLWLVIFYMKPVKISSLIVLVFIWFILFYCDYLFCLWSFWTQLFCPYCELL